MKNVFALIVLALTCVGCTGTRAFYDGDGLELVQTGADPTPVNGGWNVLVAKMPGMPDQIVAVEATPTVSQQLAMPAATVGGATMLGYSYPENVGDNLHVEGGEGGDSESGSEAAGGDGGNGGTALSVSEGGKGGTAVAGSRSTSTSESRSNPRLSNTQRVVRPRRRLPAPMPMPCDNGRD